MTLPRPARVLLLPAALVAIISGGLTSPGSSAYPQKGKKGQPKSEADTLLQPKPRPKRPELPPSKVPFEFIKGERIALVGNSTAERMNLFGHFETLLHLRFPDRELVVRNFGRPADEVAIRQRSADYTKLDDPLYAFGPDTFLCFFGFNESFQGPDGVEKFKADYERFLDEYTAKYPRDDAGSKPRFVLVSPIAFEPTGDKFLPDGTKENANLKLYAEAVKAVAAKRDLAFVDVFTPTLAEFTREPGMQYTINGCHTNEAGDQVVAVALHRGLLGSGPGAQPGTSVYEKLRAAVNDKSFVHRQDYRMVNGWYVYGGRRTWDTETFPREYLKIRNMAAVRDRYVWDIAQGKPVPDRPDDSKTGELIVPPTRFGDPRQKYSEAEELRYLTPDEFIKTCTVPPGMELKLFADETMFPELAKPVQLNFDNKGRLWVACMPTYPQWKPGDPPPNDRLVILEDTDGDGKADKCKVFYDKLHCPTGFEFWNGGVLVVDQPGLLWLKDTDGDDKADVVVHLIDGWATDDTHHTCGAFEWGPGGLLYMLEGISTSTTLETPWGPHRSQGTGGCYVLDPRSLKVRQFALPGMYNMWCYVFDEWGQGIVGDGTTPNQTWDTPLSGAQYPGRKGINFILPNGERPNLGNEWLVSRNLPDEVQRQFVYACVITMNGMPRYTIRDDGAGYMGTRIMKGPKQPDDLLRSTDKHFRPADPQIGPDGALWFGDWANALIGHMQYSQRDPNRDHTRGRIYRLVGKDKPLVKPVTQFGKSVPELLEQLKEYEWRTRYRVRRELRDRPTPEVLAAVKAWVATIQASGGREAAGQAERDRLLCEALWVQQGHHAVDPELLKTVLTTKTPQARAAAARVAADDREFIPGAFDLLKKASADGHPRVRTEAIRGLSFYPTQESVDALLAAAKLPLDYWTRYTLEAALGANEAVWRPAYLAGKIDKDNPAAHKIMADVLASSKVGGAAAPHLRVLLSAEPQPAELRDKAMTALAGLRGNVNNGRAVFVRNCTACHKVGNGEGQEYGPNLAEVGKRLTRVKIIESVIDPNAELDPKFASTRIVTLDGKTVIGLVVADSKKEVVIFDGKEKRTIPADDIESRTVLKQSSMPEGQAGAMSPAEFLDLIEYLTAQK
jgi:putative heme-binding domain-containing protein